MLKPFMSEPGSMKKMFWETVRVFEDLKDAESVASQLKLPFRLLNLTDFYQNHVVTPMVEGYAAGITPNPDILCNREMKFGALLDYALSESFRSWQQGHYCRRLGGEKGTVELWEGKDKNKDQSYFFISHYTQSTQVRQISSWRN